MYNKFIILSHDDNPMYSFFRPITEWCWRKIGWEPITLTPPKHIGIRSATYSQLQRLWGWENIASFNPDAIVMLGDIDMIPLSDYWKPNPDEVTVYGHDLTGRGHVPICYVAANCNKWAEIINESMGQAILNLPKIFSDKWEEWWQVDQDYLTEKLKQYGYDRIKFIDRGFESNGYPKGRYDRSDWNAIKTDRIDSHMMRPGYTSDNFDKNFKLIHSVFGDEANWMIEYKENYIKNTFK